MNDLFTAFVIQSILWMILFVFVYRVVKLNNELKKDIAGIVKELKKTIK